MSEAPRQRGWIAWMARNPVAANLLMAVLLIGGLAVTFRIKQEVFPEYELDMVQITVPYLGATPTDVERGVLEAVEENVRGLDGVKEVRSSAREGLGSVTVELLIGTDNNKALQDIKNAVDRITSFPEETERVTVSLLTTRNKVLDLVIYGGEDERALKQLAEVARERLMQTEGITLVELSGARPLEIGVEVSQEDLRRHGLTLGGIAGAIRATAKELPGGGVKTPAGEVLLRMAERRELGQEFADIPLVRAADGTSVRLGEIATITDGFEDTDQATYYNGERAILVEVYRVGGETPIQVSRLAHEFAETFRAELPEGVGVAIQDDRSEVYRDRIRLLLRNAMIGLILVLFILGVFLELRLAFWVTMGIPISFLGAMLLLPGLEVSINMISLFAFIMALGMVVDDAIVVGENIYEMRQEGLSFIAASIRGARQIFVPVVFSVLTNMVAFAPMLFVPGFAGKIFRVIPAIIIPVFFISLVESLFILPAHLGHQRPPRERGPLAFFGRQQRRLSGGLAWAIRTLYGPVVRAALRWRHFTLAAGVGILVLTAGFIIGGRIRVRFMPHIASDWATAQVALPHGAPAEQTARVVDHMVRSAYAVLDKEEWQTLGGREVLRGVQSAVGVAGSQRGPGGGGVSGTGGHAGQVRVSFRPDRPRAFSTFEFTRQWRQQVGEVPGVDTLTFKSHLGPGGDAPISVKLSHRQVETLEAAATRLAERLAEFDGVKDIDKGFSPGKLQRNVRREPEAEALGLTSVELGAQVRHAFYGAEALRQQRGHDEVKVMVRLPESERRSEHDIEELIIRTSAGGEILLTEAGDLTSDRAYTEIERIDSRRVVTVTADVDETVTSAEEVVTQLGRDVLPELASRSPGLTFSFGGERQQLTESLESLRWGFLMALIVIYAMLAVPLRSYVQPLIIMTAIPFGLVGAVLGHVVMGYDLSLMSMMGIVALAGVVVNDSLILICSTNDRRRAGMNAFEAVGSAAVRRFRPILLTSLTTFFGLAPMIFETSLQARFLIPMAISLGYGVLAATFITLLLVPSLYLVIEDLRRARAAVRGGAPPRFVRPAKARPASESRPVWSARYGDAPASLRFGEESGRERRP